MDADQRKLLSILSHAAIFLSWSIISFGIPVVIFLTAKDPAVKENARESLNFHVNIYVYAAIIFLLSFVVIGLFLAPVLALAALIMPIIAIVRTAENPNVPYRYPFVFRIF